MNVEMVCARKVVSANAPWRLQFIPFRLRVSGERLGGILKIMEEYRNPNVV